MTTLDAKFIENAREKPVEFEHGVNVVYFSKSDATGGEGIAQVTADLQVTMNEAVIGYITKSASGPRGVVPATEFGRAIPVPFRTLEGALELMLPGAADGLAETPRL